MLGDLVKARPEPGGVIAEHPLVEEAGVEIVAPRQADEVGRLMHRIEGMEQDIGRGGELGAKPLKDACPA